MGVNLKELLLKKEIDFNFLSNKVLAVDTFNQLYQYLTIIRQRDGTPLMDSKGRITSHLSGLFFRTLNLLRYNIKPIFVFDGKPPELKKHEKERREKIKEEAQLKYEEAKKEAKLEEAFKFAIRTARLSEDMIEDAKKLIQALGLPIIQAPSEGEAQAAFLVKENYAYAVASEDYDSLLYSADRIVKNLSITGRRKLPGRQAYVTIKPELIELAENLNNLGIDQEQLIILAMLIGTDYNPGGIKGIGPKKALELVKKFKHDYDALFKEVKWDEYFSYEWQEVFYLIKKMPVEKHIKFEWKEINQEEIYKLLVDEHDFSKERIDSALKELEKKKEEQKQKSLEGWFK